MIGIAAVMMMATIGRIAGISSILSSTLKPASAVPWQWAFVGGLLLSGLLVHWLGQPIVVETTGGTLWLIVAGLLVGFGTRLGSGCTSGHGVCGISRFSPRSIAASATFIAVGMATVFLLRLIE